MKRIFTITALLLLLSASAFATALEDLQVKPVTTDRVKYFPVPDDNRNYMFLQSIGDDTYIVIGDFSGLDKMIILITDKHSDNKVDSVVEYFPLTKNLRMRKASESKFFNTDLAKLKRDIISGNIFKKNYTDDMKSQDALESIIMKGESNAVFEDVYGFNVKLIEVDETNKFEALFTYGKNAGGYYLQFRTEYCRKDYCTIRKPILRYSVYCKDSKDPIVQEYVEKLFKIRTPKAATMK